MSSSINTEYIQTGEHRSATFDSKEIRTWTQNRLNGTVLNACCGPSELNHTGKVIRNDIDESIPSDFTKDAGELAAVIPQRSVDTIVFDPPWSLYQANLRYNGHHFQSEHGEINTDELPQSVSRNKSQLGHARLAKDGFDYMLKPGGTVIQLSYNGTCMPGRLGYERKERAMFDPIGRAKTLIGSVDRKVQTKF